MIEARLRRTATSVLLGAMKSVGAFTLSAQSEKRRASLLILCYHGLSQADEHEWLPKLFITPEGFRQRLETLRQMKANVLHLGAAIQHLHAGTLPPNSVVITFDDGFVDFRQSAVPLLNEFQMPATLYLTTYYCNYRLPIVNLALDYILWKCHSKSWRTSLSLPEYGFATEMPITNYRERQAVVWEMLAWANKQQLNTIQKDEMAQTLAHKLNVDDQTLRERRMLQIMTPEEACETYDAGVDLQLHTHRHRTPRDKNLFQREIRDNSNFIRDITGDIPAHFCYPSGDTSAEFLPWLTEMGVETATTCERGLAQPQSNNLLLPRFLDDSSVDLLRFQSFVAGLFT